MALATTTNRLSKLLGHLEKEEKVSVAKTSTEYPKFDVLSSVYPEFVDKIKKIFGDDRYTEDVKILDKYGREVIGFGTSVHPQCVVFPINTQEVSQLCKLCNSHSPPINMIPFAAGTSLESHIIAHQGGITVSFAKMDKIIKVYQEDMQVTVQPGINWMELNKHLAKHYSNELAKTHLFLGVDPAPAASIGGMCGTCCSGPLALKYGTMKNQIVNMTVVLNDGTIIKTGQRAKKTVAGYDLNSVFVGSEGTLGMITEVTLKLNVFPKYVEIGQALFDNIIDISKCIYEINQTGLTHSNLMSFEYLDDNMCKCLNNFNKKSIQLIENKHILLFQFGGPTMQHVECDINLISSIVSKYTKIPFLFSKNEKEREKLWKARKLALYAAKFARIGYNVAITDVSVPISNFANCLLTVKKEIDKIEASTNIIAPIVGHVGDANFHCAIMFDKNNDTHVKIVEKLNHFIVHTALDLDGTCTAEHGIGIHKKQYLKKEFGENAITLMQKLKIMLDPNNIFNRGKVVDI